MREVQVLPDAAGLAFTVAAAFLERLAAAQRRGEIPDVALTGGTIAGAVHQQIAALAGQHQVDWGQVRFWWGDERFVAPDSADRNALSARHDFLDPVGASLVHEMPSTADAANVDQAASAYADLLRSADLDSFDLVMLGVGPDGHVASLFPHSGQLEAAGRITVGVSDSPKPPRERISLTFEALNRTRAVWFLASGDAKADAVARALAEVGDVGQTPARGITAPSMTWFLDDAAASRL